MRYLLFILLILFSSKCLALDLNKSDSIKYSLFIYFGCENQIKRITEYTIEDRTTDSIVLYKPDSLGICFLPNDSNTFYFLRAPVIHYLTLSIDKSKEIVTDTITIPPIYNAPIRRGFYIGPTYYQYYKCGEQCDGFQKAYRTDGQLWQKGHFKRGKLKCLKHFYPNGLIESKIKERIFNGCDATYDKSGKLIVKLSYFLFVSRYKIYDKENEKYLVRYVFGQYK